MREWQRESGREMERAGEEGSTHTNWNHFIQAPSCVADDMHQRDIGARLTTA